MLPGDRGRPGAGPGAARVVRLAVHRPQRHQGGLELLRRGDLRRRPDVQLACRVGERAGSLRRHLHAGRLLRARSRPVRRTATSRTSRRRRSTRRRAAARSRCRRPVQPPRSDRRSEQLRFVGLCRAAAGRRVVLHRGDGGPVGRRGRRRQRDHERQRQPRRRLPGSRRPALAGRQGAPVGRTGATSDRGCGSAGRGHVAKVSVAVARRAAHGRCRFAGASGRLGKARSCSHRRYLRAHGTSRWSVRFAHRLPRGHYTAWVRARDAAGNARTNTKRFAVR